MEKEMVIMKKEEVMTILPHRDPILLVDKVVSGSLLFGYENISCSRIVTGKESVLEGHFPGRPIWPGIYTVEGFAQSAGILLYLMAERDKEDVERKGYFAGIDKARFSGLIEPGAEIAYSVRFDHEKRNFYFFSCHAHVNDKRVAKAEIMIVVP